MSCCGRATMVEAAPQPCPYAQAQAVQVQQVQVQAAPSCGQCQQTAPALPPPDYSCAVQQPVPCGQNRFMRVAEPTVVRNFEQHFSDCKTAVRENNTHIQHDRTVVTNVNRNHNHLLRIVTKENNFHHFLTNNVVRVNDIHRQRIENVPGETRNFRDYKATQRVEHGGCRRADCAVAAAPVQVQAVARTVAVAAPQRTVIEQQPVQYAAAPAVTYAAPVQSYAAPAQSYAAPAVSYAPVQQASCGGAAGGQSWGGYY